MPLALSCWSIGFGVENKGPPESLCCPMIPPTNRGISFDCCEDVSGGPPFTGEILAEVGLLPFLGGGGGGTFFCLLPEYNDCESCDCELQSVTGAVEEVLPSTARELKSDGGAIVKDPGLVGDLGLAEPVRIRFIVEPCVDLAVGPDGLITGPESRLAEFLFGEDGESGGVFRELKNALRAACFCVAKPIFSPGWLLIEFGGDTRSLLFGFVTGGSENDTGPFLTESVFDKDKFGGLLMCVSLDSSSDLSKRTLVFLSLISVGEVLLLEVPSVFSVSLNTGGMGKTGLTGPQTW